MTLTASGQMSINDINVEFGRSGTTANSSLTGLSDGTVATINTDNASANRPDTNAPHNMTEFYSYDHDLVNAASWASWQSGNVTFENDAGSTYYANKSIAVTSGSGVVDMWYTLNSGTVRGTLSVALSVSAFPDNSATYTTIPDGQGDNFAISFSLSGSQTVYCRFKYITHFSLAETSNRSIYIRNNNTTSSAKTMLVQGF